jgi:FkbM family methyltransferase
VNDADGLAPWGAFAPTGLRAQLIAACGAFGDNWAGRRLAFGLRRFARGGLDGPLDVERYGVRLRLAPRGNLNEARVLFTPQYFDPVERAALETRIRPGWRFIDIGANVGAYALFVAHRAGPDAKVLAIEPHPEMLRRLRANVGFNPQAPVTVVQAAVSAADGAVALTMDARNAGRSRIAGGGDQDERVEVPATTLLGLVRAHGLDRIDGLKIDIEGGEPDALLPFFRDAPRSLWPGLMILERGEAQWDRPLVAPLMALGYRVAASSRMNHIMERA